MLALAGRRRGDGLERALHFHRRRVRIFRAVHVKRIRLVDRRRMLGGSMVMHNRLRHGRMVRGDRVSR